ncbi:MAG: hypothetical protein ACRD2D_03990 [Terriglobales bacterium]
MTRRLLPIALCALFACAALSASPLTVYFTGVCSDCVGLGANGTVNAAITFTAPYFYNIIGPIESTNLAYGDDVNGTFTGVDAQTSSIAKFVYDGSNVQPLISTTLPYSTLVNFGWNGQNPFPGAQSVSIEWGNPTGISWAFNTVLNSLNSSGDWSFVRTDNGHRNTEDQGTHASWSFTAPPPSTVPEPATLAELAGGLSLLGVLGLTGKLRG